MPDNALHTIFNRLRTIVSRLPDFLAHHLFSAAIAAVIIGVAVASLLVWSATETSNTTPETGSTISFNEQQHRDVLETLAELAEERDAITSSSYNSLFTR